MNRDQLITALARKQGCSQAEAGRFLGSLEGVIQEAVSNGQEVPTKLGKFLCQHRQARKGHNPQTGEPVEIPAKDVPAFKPSKAFKDAVA